MARLVGWLWGWRDGEVSNLSLYLSIFNFFGVGDPWEEWELRCFSFFVSRFSFLFSTMYGMDK